MSRNKKVLRNIIITILIVFMFFPLSGLYLTPMSAHIASERSAHYGPSKVVHIEKFDDGRYFLGKYDKWASCNTVDKDFLFFWSFGNQVHGFEQDPSKAIDYTWGMSNEIHYKLYGIINDDSIVEIEITLRDGQTFTSTDFYEDMFLFTWTAEKSGIYESLKFETIKGYDVDKNIIFQDQYPE